MITLSPQSISAAALLKAIAYTEFKSNSDLARAAGRQPNNMTRDLASLENAGWITRDPVALTDAGREVLAAVERMEGGAEAVKVIAAADGIVGLLHVQILPSSRNPRRDWDSDEAKESLAELAASIKAEGRILQNLVVRRQSALIAEHVHFFDGDGFPLPIYELVAGERRWRAVKQLIEGGDWPEDRPLPVLITDLDDAGHDRVALIENLKRRDLKPLEEARAFKRLTEGGMKTVDIAEAIHMTQRLVQQRLQLLELNDSEQARLDQGELTIEAARTILANRPKPIEVTPEQTLVFLELAQAVAKAGQFWTRIPVDYRAARRLADGEDLAWLRKFANCGEDWQTGRSEMGFAYPARQLLAQLTGAEDLKAGALAKPLREARAMVSPAHDRRCNPLSANYDPGAQAALLDRLERDGAYMTDFLQPPFMIDPERVKAIEERRAAEADRAAEQKAEQARHAATRKAREENSGRVRQLAMAFAEPVKPEPSKVDEILAAYGHPLPWCFRPGTEAQETALTDADGEDIPLDVYAEDDCLFALVMAAVNRAGGFDPVLVEPAPVPWEQQPGDAPAPDRQTFVGWIAERLQQTFPAWKPERCRAKAGHALDDSLKTDGGIAFGEPGYGWERVHACEIADEWSADPDDDEHRAHPAQEDPRGPGGARGQAARRSGRDHPHPGPGMAPDVGDAGRRHPGVRRLSRRPDDGLAIQHPRPEPARADPEPSAIPSDGLDAAARTSGGLSHAKP